MKKISLISLLAILLSQLWSPAAHASPGEVNCGTSGTYHVNGTVVDTSHDCVGSVTFDQSITEIGENAFANYYNHETNANVSEINFAADSSLITIGAFAFESSIGTLTQLHLPNSVTFIGKHAFNNAASLQTLTLGNSVETLDEQAFAGAAALTSVELPHSLVTIGTHVFADSGITSLRIPSSIGVHAGSPLGTIPSNAFEFMPGLTSVYIEDGIGVISSNAFGWDINLASIRLPETLTEIEEFAFYQVRNITEIRIPNSVTTIGNQAFINAQNVEQIYIGSGLQYLGAAVFGSDWADTDPLVLTCLTNLSEIDAAQLFTAGIEIAVPACAAPDPPAPVVPTPSPPAYEPEVPSPAAIVGSLSSRTAFTKGGELLSVFGENLSRVSSVTIDGVEVKITSRTDAALVLVIPLHSAGLVDLVFHSANSYYTYQNAIEFKSPPTAITKVTAVQSFNITAKTKSLSTSQLKLLAQTINSVDSPGYITCSVSYPKYSQSKVVVAAAKFLAQSACLAAKKLQPQLSTTVSTIATYSLKLGQRSLKVSVKH